MRLTGPTLIALLALVSGACAPEASAPEGGRAGVAVSAMPTPSSSASPVGDEPVFSNEPLGTFTKRRAMRHIRKLASSIGVRVRATQSERLGARYIKRRFEAFGYKTKVQKFSIDGGTSRNVVAWWPMAARFPFIAGAHMDSVPGAPGANDNASGVAVLLETARTIAGRRPARWVRFVAFGSEERGADGTHHRGSDIFVRRLGKRGRARLAGMVSVDMVADGRPLLVGSSGIDDDIVARALYRKIDRAGIGVEMRTFCDCSDNGPFELAGIPAALMWSGSEPDYHSPSDTVENLVPKDVLRSGRALRQIIEDLNRALIRRFRRA